MFKLLHRAHNLVHCQIVQQNLLHYVSNNFKAKERIYPLIRRHFCSGTITQSEESEEPNYERIAQGDKDLEHKLKVLALEVEVSRQEGNLVPDNKDLKDAHWLELLKCETRSSRRRFLTFLFKTQKRRENEKLKREQKKLERGEKPPKKENETFEEFVQQYDLSHNNIFLRFHDKTMNTFYNNRLVQAMKFGQKLVVDCGYDANMTKRESINCAKQLMLLFSENRAHNDPYDLHFCNVNPDGVVFDYLKRHIPSLTDDSFPLYLHEKSYLDLFPRKQLLYLTPHCREEINEYDHDTIYIIGGIVDKMNQEPLSLAKAKKEGVKMAKFPLDRYLQFGSGRSKSLTLNQVTSVLLDLKVSGDWNFALRHVPKRKVAEYEPKEDKPMRTWRPNKDVHQQRDKVRSRVTSLFDE